MTLTTDKTPQAGRRRFRTLPLHVVLIVVGAVMAVPLLYAVVSGFKSTDQLSGNPVGLPDPWVVSNYTDILGSGSFWRLVGNSTLIAVATTVIVVAVSALAAFSGQTRVWPRTFWWLARARSTISSPAVQSKTPGSGSVAYHFIPLPGVIWSNSLPRRAV
ncbi:hypothetical protein SFUMM280S_09557 [Streptomyces fumanus]